MIIKGTSCYANAKSGNLVSITGDGGNAWGFYGNAYKKMSPRLYLWQYYDQNPDNLAEDELINWYIKEFYNLRLKIIFNNQAIFQTQKMHLIHPQQLLSHTLSSLPFFRLHFNINISVCGFVDFLLIKSPDR